MSLQGDVSRPVAGTPPGGRVRLVVVAVLVGVLVLAASWLAGPRPVRLSEDRTGDQALAEALAPHLSGNDVVSVATWTGDGEVRYAGFGADERSEFEIGSNTKTFTGALLMDAVDRGEVTLDTTVGEILGERAAGAPVADVTLRELASHSAGLSRGGFEVMPLSLMVLRKDPFSGASKESVIEAALADPLATRGTGVYSNTGLALLGHLLGEVAGKSWSELLRERLLDPMGLANTYDPSADGLRPGAPTGQTALGQSHAAFANPGIAPAGMMRSTAEDMATWIRSMQDGSNPGARGLDPIAPIESPYGAGQMGVTWFLVPAADGGTLVMHGGTTGGYMTFAGYHRETGRGVIILSATVTMNVIELGHAMLNGEVGA